MFLWLSHLLKKNKSLRQNATGWFPTFWHLCGVKFSTSFWQNVAEFAKSECLHREAAEAAGQSELDAVALLENGGEMTGFIT